MATLTRSPTTTFNAGAWTNPGNLYTSNNTYATLSATSNNVTNPMQVRGFDFSALDAGATLNSVQISIEHFENQTTQLSVDVSLVDNTTVLGTASVTPRTAEGVDTVTITGVSIANLKSATLGLRVEGMKTGGGGTRSFSVDHVQIVVNYTDAAPTPPAGSIVHTQSFTGTDGADWPAGWTFMSGDASGTTTRTIQSNQGQQSTAASTNFRNDMLTGLADVANFDVTFTVNPMVTDGSTGNQPAFFFRADSALTTLTGYYLEITALDPAYGRLRLMRAPAYSGLQDYLFTHGGAGSIYKMRVQGNGNVLRAKIWPSADSEPGAWGLTYTDASNTHTTGRFGFTLYTPDKGRSVRWDDLVIYDTDATPAVTHQGLAGLTSSSALTAGATQGRFGAAALTASSALSATGTVPAVTWSPETLTWGGTQIIWDAATGYSDEVLADSPVGYWRLGDASGSTVAVDETGTMNGSYYADGSTVGRGPTVLSPGAIPGNDAASFDGGDHIRVPYVAAHHPTGAFTVEAWVKPTDYTTVRTILSRAKFNSGFRTRLNTDGTTYCLVSDAATTNFFQSSGTTAVPLDGAWHHVAIAYNPTAGEVRHYVDGQPAGTTTHTAGWTTDAHTDVTAIGMLHAENLTEPFAGGMDEVALYPTALSAARVLAHYDARSGGSATTHQGLAALTASSTFVAGATPTRFGTAALTASSTLTSGATSGPADAYAAAVLADSPIGYYRLDDASGTAMTATAGNAGTYTGSPTLGAASLLSTVSNAAVAFDSASAQYAQTGTMAQLAVSSGSIECWVKTQGTGTAVAWRDFTGGGGWYLNLSTSNISFAIGGTVYTSTTASSTVKDNQPHHIVVTTGTTNVTLYIDGVQAYQTARGAGTTISTTTWFLAKNGSNAQYLTATLDEFAVYATELTSARVAAHYAAVSATQQGAATLTASSTLASGATPTRLGAAAMSSSSVLTSAGLGIGLGAAALAASSVLTSAAAIAQAPPAPDLVFVQEAAAAMSAASTLTSAGMGIQLGSAGMSASSILTSATVRSATVGAALSSSSTLTAGAAQGQFGAIALSSSSTLTGTAATLGQQDGAVALVSTSTATFGGLRAAQGAVTLSASSSLVSGAVRQVFAGAALASSSTLGAVAQSGSTVGASFVATSALSAGGGADRPGAASLTAGSTLEALARATTFAAVVMQATSLLVAAFDLDELEHPRKPGLISIAYVGAAVAITVQAVAQAVVQAQDAAVALTYTPAGATLAPVPSAGVVLAVQLEATVAISSPVGAATIDS